MGLAASQARFLNLTARKTNLEFEGQQINQQRTMLANQSANYYSQMLTLTVPVPPSETSFSTVVYTFSKDNELCTINQVTGSDSSASIIFTRTTTNNYNMNKNSNPKQISLDAGKYSYKSNELICLNDATGEAFKDDVKNSIAKALGFSQDETGYKNVYILNVGTEGAPSYEYYKKADLPTTSEPKAAYGYRAGSIQEYKQDSVSDAQIRRDANNRIVAITAENLGEDVAITASTVKDNVAYEEAYNEYTYQTYLYQQEMEEINAQTSVIQAQDKKLELRLKQLDTEQNAVSTEMDNITNLIKKDIENSFKIFA